MNFIKEARQRSKLTMEEIADRLGITPRYLYRFENEGSTVKNHFLFPLPASAQAGACRKKDRVPASQIQRSNFINIDRASYGRSTIKTNTVEIITGCPTVTIFLKRHRLPAFAVDING